MSIASYIHRKLRHFEAYILHITIFNKTPGAVDFYGLNDDEMPASTDGQCVTFDTRSNPAKRRAYYFRFEDRYLMFLPIGRRVKAVYQALEEMDGVRPAGVVENGKLYTPYGHYDSVPKEMRDILQPA
jgi:hypothetical protein